MQRAAHMQETETMPTKTNTSPTDEPLGIIISRGSREEPTPVFSTYVWGPAPVEGSDDASKAA